MRGGASAAPAAIVDTSSATPGAAANPLQKFIEVAGVRFVEEQKDKDKVVVRFALINHSDADIANLAGNVTIRAKAQNPTRRPLARFPLRPP